MRVLGASSCAILLMLLTLTILPVAESHETAEAISGESETTINLVKANADLSLTAVSSDGTFAASSSSEQAQFSVTTTNYTGYTLTIAASDDNQTLVNTDTSITTHNTFTSIPNGTVIDEKTFDDASYNGYWGYKPSKMNSTVNVGFWPSPTQTATTLDVTEGANSTANNYTIALGARADYTQATGTYSKTMTLAATANPSSYSVTYTDNTGTNGNKGADVTNLPDTTSSTTSATSITLSSVTPSRTGYAFKGWCTVAPTNSGQTCSGTLYTVGGTYPIDQTTSNIITLYATWEVPTYDVTIKTVSGITSVSLNGTTCTSTSGCTVADLVYGQSYTLSATVASGSEFGGWSNNGAGSVADVTANPTTYTVGSGASTIIPMTTTTTTSSLTVNFTGTGTVQSVQVRTGAGASGGTLVGTITSSGGTVSGLISGAEYYLYPTLQSGHSFSSWTNTGSYGYLICSSNTIGSSCSELNAHLIIGAGNGTVAISSSDLQNVGNIQNLASSKCTTTPAYATDTRDGQEYVIQRLADGKCWMMTNLNLGAVALTTDLTSSNTNLSSTVTASTFNGWKKTSGTATYTAGEYIVQTGTDTNNGLPYGTLYNYYAASAGTISGSSNSDNASYDLCPKGWRLPTGGSSGEFQTLYNNYNSNALMRAPYAETNGGAAFTLAGYFYNGAPTNQGSRGRYWSSTRYDNTYMYFLYLKTSDVDPADGSSRNFGYPIRCVLK